MTDMLTYVHYYTENGTYLDHGKILDVEPYVGYIVERYKIEGYEPWEIVKIEKNGTVFENRSLIKATVKIHPYVKTHCDHDWDVENNLQLAVGVYGFTRICKKCNKSEKFDYVTARWIKND
jgi:hypothetical protein